MKIILQILFILNLFVSSAQTAVISDTCDLSAGNLHIFANYEGGDLVIDIYYNEPNIKIGVLGFYFSKVTLTGAYKNNVTEIAYAGVGQTTPNNCGNNPASFQVIGASPACIISSQITPIAPFLSTHGSSEMYCAYDCDTTTWQGGCNTRDQVESYFENVLNATTGFYFTQYDCWQNTDSTIFTLGFNNIGCAPIGVQSNTVIAAFEISDTTVCVGQTVTFTNLSSPLASPYWSLVGASGIISTDTNQVYTFDIEDNYPIYLQNSAGCVAVLILEVESCAEMTEEIDHRLQFSPNPSTGILYFNSEIGQGKLIVKNTSGQEIGTFEYTKKDQSFDFSYLPSGMYFIELYTEQAYFTGKWLKEQ